MVLLNNVLSSENMISIFDLLLQIIEACLISLITSIISFGLPLFRKCSPCPDSDSTIECPHRPGTYGNYVNVSSVAVIFKIFLVLSWTQI